MTYLANGDSSPMHMCMSIFSKEDDAHVHSHPIIFKACSVHAQCVKVLDQTKEALG